MCVCPLCGGPNVAERQPLWKKVLFAPQSFEDDYVDKTFLDSLITNANINNYNYFDLCRSTVSVTQHLSCIGIFVVVWRLISNRRSDDDGDDVNNDNNNSVYLSAKQLIIVDVALLAIGYCVKLILRPNAYADSMKFMRSAVVVFGCLLMLSPVLQTLTRTFSDDTVFALTTMCIIAHGAIYDYTDVRRHADKEDYRVTGSVALNAAMSAAVLLASRLETTLDVFAFLFFGIEIFALSPILRGYILHASETAYVYVVTPILFVVTAFLLHYLAMIVVHLYIVSFVFTTFVSSLWLIFSMKYKNEIRGPWDLPRIRVYQ